VSPSQLSPYLKFVVAALGVISTAVQTAGGTGKWQPVVTAAISALLVWLVPNLPHPSVTVIGGGGGGGGGTVQLPPEQFPFGQQGAKQP
jgi:hypothetical protein